MNSFVKFSYQTLLNLPTARSQRLKIAQFLWSIQNYIKYRDRFFFSGIAIDISTGCNRKCWYCPQAYKPDDYHEMSFETFDIILKRLQDINWTGIVGYCLFGEPLMDSRIVEFVRRTRHALPDCIPFIQTNGDFLTEKLCDELILNGLDIFSVMRHSPSNSEWENRLTQLNKKYPTIVRLDQLDKNRLQNRAGFLTKIISPRTDKRWRCHYILVNFPIRYNGDVGFCTDDYHRKVKIGNILEQDILTIWRNPHWANLRKQLRAGHREVLDICKTCTGCQVD